MDGSSLVLLSPALPSVPVNNGVDSLDNRVVAATGRILKVIFVRPPGDGLMYPYGVAGYGNSGARHNIGQG